MCFVSSLWISYILFMFISLSQLLPVSTSPYLPELMFYHSLSQNRQTWSEVCVGQLLLSIQHALECGCYPTYHSIEENLFCYQQQSKAIISLFRGEALCLLPIFHAQIFVGIQFVQDLYVLSPSLWLNICAAACVSGKCFLDISHIFWLLPSFYTSAYTSWSFGDVYDAGIPFRAEHSMIFYSLHVVQLWVSS